MGNDDCAKKYNICGLLVSSLGGRRTSINICGSRSFEQQTSDYLLVGTVGVVSTLALAESGGRQSVSSVVVENWSSTFG